MPSRVAVATVLGIAYCVAWVLGVGWFDTGQISWSSGITDPRLVPFWMGLSWPLSDWRRRLAGPLRFVPVLIFAGVLVVLCWLYPAQRDEIAIFAVWYPLGDWLLFGS